MLVAMGHAALGGLVEPVALGCENPGELSLWWVKPVLLTFPGGQSLRLLIAPFELSSVYDKCGASYRGNENAPRSQIKTGNR